MKVISVSQLNRYVKSLLEGDANLAAVYIGGEISNFTNHYKSGHLYMSLKDEGALVKAVMFRAYASKLAFTPENGMKVIVRARVSLYEKDGAFQIYIEEMQPDGVGALQIAFEQLKKKLAAEGLFEASRKKPLPRYPARVGVITSPNETDAADVLIIGRGGGSIEELWAFNDETVARAVAASRIPVISAVGHETDFTICDFVADLRAPTPSAAAELAVPDQHQLAARLTQLYGALRQSALHRVQVESTRLAAIREKRCLATPLFYVEEQGMRLDYFVRRFAAAAQVQTSRAEGRLSAAAGKLDALSPLKVLSRGYSIVYKDGEVQHSAQDIRPGDKLSLRLSDGRVECTAD